MTYLHTCQRCKADPKDCATRAALLLSLRGSGVTSAKHRCADFVPRYRPGDAIEVLTVAYMGGDPDEEGRPPPRGWFPGHFVRYSGSRTIAYVKPGSPSDRWGETYRFESVSGIVKVPRSRVRPSDWSPPICADQCRECGAEPGLGQPCQRDPNYGRRTHCLAEKISSEALPPPPPDPLARCARCGALHIEHDREPVGYTCPDREGLFAPPPPDPQVPDDRSRDAIDPKEM